ncbi:MAG: flagellar basal body rod protein FlgB [Clostridiales bacterium]|nr:flagellar basal body rod protein FlgB [Clostridiales bacterium]
MLFDSMYFQNAIIGSAMQAAVFRNEVISNNIANADTPGFKKSRVEFEDSLREALDNFKQTGAPDFGGVDMRAVITHENFNYRLDENNVDMETEMSALYQNAARYDALTSMLTNNGKRFNLVVTGR